MKIKDYFYNRLYVFIDKYVTTPTIDHFLNKLNKVCSLTYSISKINIQIKGTNSKLRKNTLRRLIFEFKNRVDSESSENSDNSADFDSDLGNKHKCVIC